MSDKQDDVRRVFSDLQHLIEQAAKPYLIFQKEFQKFNMPALANASEFERLTRQIIETQKSWTNAFKPLELWSRNFAVIERQGELLDRAGFLPHTTTPMYLLEKCAGDPETLSNEMEKYYRDNWRKVRGHLTERVRARDIDRESKEAFFEALGAHEGGLYRLVCRGLLPEIERLARIVLGEIKLPTSPRSNKVIRLLQDLAADLPASEIEPQGYLGLRLFERLTAHLYEQVGGPDERKKLQADAVPNRNAALHGLVNYKSCKNSLNALFMTDYAFQIISAIKKQYNLDTGGTDPT